MSNNYIKGLYDMSKSTDSNGLSKFDEQKLRKHFENNNKLFASNKDIFKKEPKFYTCSLYEPCPICYKCRAKASHLFVRCQNCDIPVCVHTYKNRKQMIRRENFKIHVSDETKKALKEMAAKVLEGNNP